jgi:hypothetical protein
MFNFLGNLFKYVAPAVSIASAFTSAFAKTSQGRGDKEAYDFKATVNRQQADRERQVSQIESRNFKRDNDALAARRRAEFGATGVQQSTGSPLLATEDFLTEMELQEQIIRFGGNVRAERLEQQGNLNAVAGRAAQRRGYASAGSSLLTGLSSFG